MASICHLDYETRSECDLKLAGAYVYARHPSTRVLCCAYSLDGGPVQCWPSAAGHRMPRELRDAMRNPKCEMHAWNAQFERLITKHVLDIDIPLERWRCTAALARCRGMPGKLEDALRYLGEGKSLAEKRKGSSIMLKWCKPLPLGGWADDPNEYVSLVHYCKEDVASEMLVAHKLHPLRAWEQAEYELTERINDRGLPVDVNLAKAAQAYGAQEKAELSSDMASLTGGIITSTSQHARVKEWLKGRLGEELFEQFFVKWILPFDNRAGLGGTPPKRKESTDKAARLDFLQSEAAKEADPEVVELIEILDDAGKASVAKYTKIAARAADTGRAQGAYICWGAIQTKRYSSTGIQVHNFPRKTPKNVQEAVWEVLEHRVEGKVMHTLSSLLRPTIKAAAGRQLIWGDWTAVEAKGMPWLAGCERKLELYRQGIDVYRVNAETIFGTPYADVQDHERQIGKVAELSLQFGGARGALKSMARGYGISLSDDMADLIVSRWRLANDWAARFSWKLFEAFMHTAQGTDSGHGVVQYRQIEPLIPGTRSIACDLPGDTTLYYHSIKGEVGVPTRAGIVMVDVNESEECWSREVHHRSTEVSFVKSLPGGFRTERIWHGLLAENVTQALCATLLRDCSSRVDFKLHQRRMDASLIGHTHDEMILDCSDDHAKSATKVLQTEMIRVPEWLAGFPLGCEVKTGQRYVK